MPRITHEQKALYKSKIRSVISRNHQISSGELAVVLSADGLDLERHYLSRLLKEIHAERIRRADREIRTPTVRSAIRTPCQVLVVVVRREVRDKAVRRDPMAGIRRCGIELS